MKKIIYIPVFNTGWSVISVNACDCRRLGGYILHAGTIYGDTAYITEAAAWAYINKEYVPDDLIHKF